MGKEDSDEFNKISDERNNSNKNILNFYTDENNCVLPNKISGAYSEFHNFIKSNKIPEYAREYKREYQFIRGLNKEFGYFIKKLNDLNKGLFESNLTNRIKNFMKRFLRAQEKGKFEDISDFIFPDNILNNIIFINQQFGYYKLRYDAFCDDSDDDDSNSFSDIVGDYDSDSDSDEYNDDNDNGGDSEYLVDGKPYPGFIEFYDIFKKIFNQIKNDDSDDCDSDDCESDSDREELDLSYTDSDLEDFCNHLNSFFS